ncbi:MAG: UDP-N-acetylmuramoyl-L-alanyl-D-glutamate--2,6-diaminopimelate ligase [Ardenticatenaceae bacterium]|nr:UDP-N-acetylmuramoyl-L-alanyl-D-glutamate--2,6-diaminopimelate ligase [Ardenticatenaceae bacterium]
MKQLLTDWGTAVHNTRHLQPPTYTGPDVQLTHLTEKTSEIKPGAGFVARVRTGSDGHPYIGKAIELGASLILAQRSPAELGLTIPDGVVYLQVADTAESLAWLAAAWEGFPSRDLVVIGITGTDGKSSTANILYEILRTAGLKVGLLSTIKAVIGGEAEPLALHVTTPEAPVVQHYLRRMVNAGMTHVILETTSHALAQYRVTAVHFDIAAITNITHEHLDYHGSWEAYFAAKASLFEKLTMDDLRYTTNNKSKRHTTKTAVLNLDDSSYDRLQNIPAPRQITYAIHQPADFTASSIIYAADQTRFELNITYKSVLWDDPINLSFIRPLRPPSLIESSHYHVSVSSSLVGEFNIYNMLAAAAMASLVGATPDAIKQGLEAVAAIDGRMQRIHRGQPFPVIVDFAHTPNALAKALAAARTMLNQQSTANSQHSTKNQLTNQQPATNNQQPKLITAFGSAGKRDVEKRRLMAEIAARDADLVILTAEDPRTESLDDILAMMADGCRSQGGVEGETFWRIPDRGKAIYFALTLARPQDLVLICGKGHEQSMCFGTIEYPWDDREATRAALDAFLQGQPMPNLGLPTFDMT